MKVFLYIKIESVKDCKYLLQQLYSLDIIQGYLTIPDNFIFREYCLIGITNEKVRCFFQNSIDKQEKDIIQRITAEGKLYYVKDIIPIGLEAVIFERVL